MYIVTVHLTRDLKLRQLICNTYKVSLEPSSNLTLILVQPYLAFLTYLFSYLL